MPNDPNLFVQEPDPIARIHQRLAGLDARLSAVAYQRGTVITPFDGLISTYNGTTTTTGSFEFFPYMAASMMILVGGYMKMGALGTAQPYRPILKIDGVDVVGSYPYAFCRDNTMGTPLSLGAVVPAQGLEIASSMTLTVTVPNTNIDRAELNGLIIFTGVN